MGEGRFTIRPQGLNARLEQVKHFKYGQWLLNADYKPAPAGI
jgi:hypothetical protein